MNAELIYVCEYPTIDFVSNRIMSFAKQPHGVFTFHHNTISIRRLSSQAPAVIKLNLNFAYTLEISAEAFPDSKHHRKAKISNCT